MIFRNNQARAVLAGVTGIPANCAPMYAHQGKSLTGKTVCWSAANAEPVLADAPSKSFLLLDNQPRFQGEVSKSRHSEPVPAYPHGFDASRGRKARASDSLSTRSEEHTSE